MPHPERRSHRVVARFGISLALAALAPIVVGCSTSTSADSPMNAVDRGNENAGTPGYGHSPGTSGAADAGFAYGDDAAAYPAYDGATAASDAGASSQQAVNAGEWDDNANYREFLGYLASNAAEPNPKLDVSGRRFVVVRDRDGKPIADCPVHVSDAQGGGAVDLVTYPSGRTIVFPRAMGLVSDTWTVRASCAEGSAEATFPISADGDGALDLQLTAPRIAPSVKDVDLVFVIDTTGSMSEEIDALKATVQEVAQQLGPQSAFRVRAGLVAYRDYGDEYVTRVTPFTYDLGALQTTVGQLVAMGGGDTPEALNEAMHVTAGLDWRADAFARYAFVITDAPPHFGEPYSYATEAKVLHARGIKTFTIAASGQQPIGQLVLRQIAQYTYATNMFILQGGFGPSSTGGGDPITSCGTTQTSYATGALHSLIVEKLQDDLAAFDANPLDIPGLGVDVKDTPCPTDAGTTSGAGADGG